MAIRYNGEIKCPFCKAKASIVLETRGQREGVWIRRRRRCLRCSKIFPTYESTKKPETLMRELISLRKLALRIVRSTKDKVW